MNKLITILEKAQEIRDLIGGDAFNEVPTIEYESLTELLGEIEEIVEDTRDDGDFEFIPVEED